MNISFEWKYEGILRSATDELAKRIEAIYNEILWKTEQLPRKERIMSLLNGTKQTRLRTWFSYEEIKRIIEIFSPEVNDGAPLSIQACTSSLKYASMSDSARVGPDMMELATAIHLHILHTAVQKIYSPGINFLLVSDDNTGRVLFPGREASIIANTERLGALMKSVWDGVKFVLESSLFEEQGINRWEYQNWINKYTTLFEAYLNKTEWIDGDLHGDFEETKALNTEWWIGSIEQITRDFYHQKIERALETKNPEQIRRGLARFFATVMMKKKIELGKGQIRAAFSANIPGDPVAFARLRIQSLVWSKYRHAFWTAEGWIKLSDYGYTVSDLKDQKITKPREDILTRINGNQVVLRNVGIID